VKMKKWTLGDADHCPSCKEAAGQVHPMETWEAAGITPRSKKLYCREACRCEFEEVETEKEVGNMADIPVRSGNALETEDSSSPAESVTNQVRLSGEAVVIEGGKFEVMAITAGIGNGWEFTEQCLREGLALFDGPEVFVDHGWMGHSVRDLAGVLHSPEWDAASKGVKCQLRTMGPSGPLLEQLGKEMLSEGKAPRVGFSADVVFTSQGRKVDKLLRVLSVDLVFNPARGGAFLRALNSVQGQGDSMAANANTKTGETPEQPAQQAALASQANLSGDLAAVQTILNVQREQARLAEEAEQARAIRVQMCGYLLESGLAAAKLPQPVVERIRKQFSGKVFEAQELTQAIEDQRAMLAELTAGSVIQGPGRVSGMFSSEDKLQAAVDDLFGAPREKAQAGVQTARLSGIRELYLMLTGDDELHGGYRADRVRLATTADFTGLVKNAMNKVVANKWAELGQAGYNWWEKIVTVEHCASLNDITGILVGTVGSLPTVAEGAEYTELAIGDSPEVGSFTKYGGYIPLTLELIDRDETRKLKEYPRQLAAAGLRNISGLVAAIFTANAGVGPTLADSGALFNNTAVTTAGGHANLLTTALAAAQWEVVSAAVYNQPMLVKNALGFTGIGPKMGINPRYLLVPRALQLTGKKILYPTLENAANITSENQQQGAPGDVLTVPEWTDATDWAAVCDPAIAPGIVVGERFGIAPEIFVAGDNLSPAVFSNDESRLKVRHFLSVFVVDYRPLHKSNVAG